ncbi:hypothetical protein F5X99DRAFT_111919 [Biscogniauxia marginata]|nr:hypothetical protein F5X99DRAFT_111919 [Biscogniauxia marginata]
MFPLLCDFTNMSSLSTEALITLLGLLFCLPQLIFSALTWYEGRCARLNAEQCLEHERFMHASQHQLATSQTSAEDHKVNINFPPVVSASPSDITSYNTASSMQSLASTYQDSVRDTRQPLARTNTAAYHKRSVPSRELTARSVSCPT